ncbi:MAG: molybdate-binding protein, partial [Pseudonocardia sp.]|nr:molybdate-binding protein [Pseudonocardia sp.]
MRSTRRFAALVLGAALVLAGCGGGGAPVDVAPAAGGDAAPAVVRIAAASDLKFALDEVAAAFET